MAHALRRWAWLVAVLLLMTFPESSPPLNSSLAEAAEPVYGLTSHFGVPASPNIDVSDQINAVLAGLPTPATVVLEGMYRIDHSVVIDSQNNLHLVGSPTTGFIRYNQAAKYPEGWPGPLQEKFPFFPYVAVRGSSNITVQGFSIKGPLTQPIYTEGYIEFSHGVYVLGSTGVVVRGLRISGVHGDFVAVNEGVFTLPMNVLFEDVYGDIAGRAGSNVSAANGVTFRRVTFLRAARTGINMEPANPAGVRNVVVEGSLIADMKLSCFATHTNVHAFTARNSTCRGGKGIGKFGVNSLNAPNNQGLVFQDFVYEWQTTMPTSARGTIAVDDTDGVLFLRVKGSFNGNRGYVNGTGLVQDSAFVNMQTSPTLCLGPGMSSVSSVGTGPASACGTSSRTKAGSGR